MPRLIEVIKQAAVRPVQAIQGVIALVSLILGIYIASPVYVASSGSAVAQAFQDIFWQQALVGLGFFILPALPILLSFFFMRFATTKWYTRSTFWMFCGFLFISFLRIITVGVFPVTWVLSIAIALVVGICHLYWKVR